MKEKVSDILYRMAPYSEASGAWLEVFFVDEDFGIVEILVRPQPRAADEEIRAIQYSVEQMILQKATGVRQVEFLREAPANPNIEKEEEVPDLAEKELVPLREGTGLALEMLLSLDKSLRSDVADRILKENRQAEHFLSGPYPKWAIDARDRFMNTPTDSPPKALLRGLREVFPAVERTTRALSRVVDAERTAWHRSVVPLKDNTAPQLLKEEAKEDLSDLHYILDELRPHLGDSTLASSDDPPDSNAKGSRPTTVLLDRIFKDGSLRKVRDVYLEAGESSATLRYRFGREIRPMVEFPRTLYRSLIARIKHLASLDVSERKRRQEGRITFTEKSGYQGLNVQVQTIPDHFAERVRLRLFLPSDRRPSQ